MRFTFNAACAAVCVLFLACVAFGAPPEIIQLSPVPKEKEKDAPPPPPTDSLSVGKMLWFGPGDIKGKPTWRVKGDSAASLPCKEARKQFGIVEGFATNTDNEIPAGSILLIGVKPGTVVIELWTVIDNEATFVRDKVLVVGGDGPRPPPIDPDVDPKPKPPTPGPAPIAGDGLRVLIVYESMTTLPSAQAAAIYGQEMRDYLNAKSPKGPDGKTPEYRIYDKDTPMDNESKTWKDAMARKRESIPWLIVSNGKTGFEGPLPATLPETMKILKQYGGE